MSVTALLEGFSAHLATAREVKQRNVETLLREVFFGVSALRKAKRRFADQLAPDFRLFDYLRTDEYGLSRCLADLLDPKGNHGQNELFLTSFLEQLGLADAAVAGQCRRVVREQLTDKGRRIDIFLDFDNCLIGIENKPWARDQHLQLFDYAKWLQQISGRKKWLLVFLSNRDPDPGSIDESWLRQLAFTTNYVQISYQQLIEWLQHGAGKAKAPTVRLFVEELIKFIRTKVNGEIDMADENETRDAILASDNSLEAAFLIARSLDATKKYLLRRLCADLKQQIAARSYVLNVNEALFFGKAYGEFYISFVPGQTYQLAFGFDGSGFDRFGWGISKNAEMRKDQTFDQETWAAISRLMTSHFAGQPVLGDSPKQWVWCLYPDGEIFDDNYQNWSGNPTPWVDIRNGDLAKKINDLAVRVHGAFEGRMDLLMPIAQTHATVCPNTVSENGSETPGASQLNPGLGG